MLPAALLPLLLSTAAPTLPAASPAPAAALTVRDAVHAAVEANLDLLQKRLAARRSDALGGAAWSAFTPELAVRADVVDPVASPIGGPGAKAAPYAESIVSLAWTAPIGTIVGAGLRTRRTLDGVPADDAALVLAVRQPLLKDAWWPGAGLPLQEAALQARIQREVFREEVDAFVVEVESAWWDLALAESDVEIKVRSRDRAQQQYQDTAENIRRGILAEVEIYLVEENVVFFETELVRAEEARTQARRKLAALLWLDPDAPVSIVAGLDAPLDVEAPDEDESVGAALANSPAVEAQRAQADLARARERAAVLDALPRLDLDAAVEVGAVGDGVDPAVARLATAPAPGARVGLVFSIPLGPAPLSSYDAAHQESERARLELAGRELRVRHDVLTAIGDLAANLRLERLGRKQLALAELKLAAQTDKYKNGISTLADVVRFQRDLDDASIALKRTVRAVHVSRAKLLQREGRAAEAAGVAVR